MSMSTDIRGLRDPNDPRHRTMLAILQLCRDSKVSLPKEVALYFDPKGEAEGNPNNIDGDDAIEIDISMATRPWNNSFSQGIEVELAKLPEGVKVLRFFNSW